MEVLIVLAIIGAAFVPLMRMYATAMEQVTYVGEMRVAIDLAREEIEKLKNLGLTHEQVKKAGNVFSPPLPINGSYWRTARIIDPATKPLVVDVYIFREPNLTTPLVRLTTKMSKSE